MIYILYTHQTLCLNDEEFIRSTYHCYIFKEFNVTANDQLFLSYTLSI